MTEGDDSDTFLKPLAEMPLLPITSPATVEACRDLTVTDRDIYICSYPKSGTTWTQNLVCRLLASHLSQDLPEDWHLSHSAPFYEVDQYWQDGQRLAATTPLRSKTNGDNFRVFNTHLRPHQLPSNAKCIYIMRDPLDVLASFYYHLVNMAESDGGYPGSPAEFCQEFVEGTILYGKWQDHLESWLASVSQTCLLLHYEDMKKDLKMEASRVAAFLGVPPSTMDKVVEEAISHCSFESMRRERWRYTPQSVAWKTDPSTGKPYEDFVRTGRIGDGPTFWTTHANPKLEQKWKEDLQLARSRWERAGVDSKFMDRYL